MNEEQAEMFAKATSLDLVKLGARMAPRRGARSSARSNPPASIAGALVLGALFARLLWRS